MKNIRGSVQQFFKCKYKLNSLTVAALNASKCHQNHDTRVTINTIYTQIKYQKTTSETL